MILKFGEAWLNRSFAFPPPSTPGLYGPLDDIPWSEAIVLPYNVTTQSRYAYWTDGVTAQTMDLGSATSMSVGNGSSGMYYITNPAVQRASDGHRMGYAKHNTNHNLIAYDFDTKTMSLFPLPGTSGIYVNYMTEVWQGKSFFFLFNGSDSYYTIFDLVAQTFTTPVMNNFISTGVIKSKVSPSGKFVCCSTTTQFTIMDISAGTVTVVTIPTVGTGNWGAPQSMVTTGPGISDIITYNGKEYCVVGSSTGNSTVKLVNLTDKTITNITMPAEKAWGAYRFPPWIGTKLVIPSSGGYICIYDLSAGVVVTADTSVFGWGIYGNYRVVGRKVVFGSTGATSNALIVNTDNATSTTVALHSTSYATISKAVGNYVLAASTSSSNLINRIDVSTGTVTEIVIQDSTVFQFSSPFNGRILCYGDTATSSTLIDVAAGTFSRIVGGMSVGYSKSSVSSTGIVLLPRSNGTMQDIDDISTLPHTVSQVDAGTTTAWGGYRNILYALPGMSGGAFNPDQYNFPQSDTATHTLTGTFTPSYSGIHWFTCSWDNSSTAFQTISGVTINGVDIPSDELPHAVPNLVAGVAVPYSITIENTQGIGVAWVLMQTDADGIPHDYPEVYIEWPAPIAWSPDKVPAYSTETVVLNLDTYPAWVTIYQDTGVGIVSWTGGGQSGSTGSNTGSSYKQILGNALSRIQITGPVTFTIGSTGADLAKTKPILTCSVWPDQDVTPSNAPTASKALTYS